jgi:hypothetical protein
MKIKPHITSDGDTEDTPAPVVWLRKWLPGPLAYVGIAVFMIGVVIIVVCCWVVMPPATFKRFLDLA